LQLRNKVASWPICHHLQLQLIQITSSVQHVVVISTSRLLKDTFRGVKKHIKRHLEINSANIDCCRVYSSVFFETNWNVYISSTSPVARLRNIGRCRISSEIWIERYCRGLGVELMQKLRKTDVKLIEENGTVGRYTIRI
jgi:hypothetical protein